MAALLAACLGASGAQADGVGAFARLQQQAQQGASSLLVFVRVMKTSTTMAYGQLFGAAPPISHLSHPVAPRRTPRSPPAARARADDAEIRMTSDGDAARREM